MSGTAFRTRWAVVALALGLAGTLQGQIRGREDRPPRRSGPTSSVSLTAGPSIYDLDRSGTGVAAGIRFALPAGRKFLIEPGLGFFRYKTQTESRLAYLLPEVSLQFSPSPGSVRPYAGGGLGLAEFASGPTGGRGTVHAVAGLRLILLGRLGLRAEGRYRIYDPFGSAGTMLDLGGGASWTLGGR